MKTEAVEVGLIRGRHPLPVTAYIWDEVSDACDYKAMDRHVAEWLEANVGITRRNGLALNAAAYDEGIVFEGDRKLVVYITGLTPCTASVIKECALNGVPLTLMHYDRDTGDYRPQKIF